MRKFKRLSVEERWNVIEPIINKKKSVKATAQASGIPVSNIREWVRKYQASGKEGLENKHSERKPTG